MTVLGREDLEQAIDNADLDARLVITPLLDRRQIANVATDVTRQDFVDSSDSE